MENSMIGFGAFCLMFLTTRMSGYCFNIDKVGERVRFVVYVDGKDYDEEEDLPFERFFILDESEDVKREDIERIIREFNQFIA